MHSVLTASAPARQNIMEIHTQDVGLNALSAMIARETKHACVTNVLIHVQELVVKMLNVKLSTIFLHAHVLKVWSEMHLHNVHQK